MDSLSAHETHADRRHTECGGTLTPFNQGFQWSRSIHRAGMSFARPPFRGTSVHAAPEQMEVA